MSFIAKNPLILPEIQHTPSTPQGTRGLFAKKDGLYQVGSDNKEKKIATIDDIGGSAGTAQSDWEQNDPTKADYIKNKPIENGEGEDSIQTSNSKAISEGSIAFGKNSIAGCRGYYYQAIDFINGKIYLSNEQKPPVAVDGDDSVYIIKDYESPTYKKGSEICIFDYYCHYFCGKINNITANIIELDMNEPLDYSSIKLKNTDTVEEFDYVLFVPSQPEIGAIQIYKGGVALNEDCKASGENSVAEGIGTMSAGRASHAEGVRTRTGIHAHAEGQNTSAIGYAAHAEGRETDSKGQMSHAEGYKTQASGDYSHSEGQDTSAMRQAAHAEGNSSTASGEASHAEGYNTKATGSQSHAEGSGSTASGEASHAEGIGTISSKIGAHSEGSQTKATAEASHAEGNNTTASGEASHAEGIGTKAEGIDAHAEGWLTQALDKASHAEGYNTIASGEASHAEGYNTIAKSQMSHAEGYLTQANGAYSHAEGQETIANAARSHAEGFYTNARANGSHAEGFGTYIAPGADYQHAQGKYNKPVGGEYAHVVGNGTSEVRSNAHTLDWKGNAWFAGDVTVGANNEKLATENQIGNKVDKIEGKGLSTNDFTNEYKYKLDYPDLVIEQYLNYLNEPEYALFIPLSLNKQHICGEKATVRIECPSYAKAGDVVYLSFISGNTPTNLTIDTTNTCDIELIPEANTHYEIFGKFNGSIWLINYSEYTVSEG